MGLRQVCTRLFSIFCQILAYVFDDFAKRSHAEGAAILEKASNIICQKMKKNLLWLGLKKTIFLLILGSQKSDFGYIPDS